MARTRRTIPLAEKIEKAQVAVFQAKDKYDTAVEELNKLQKKNLNFRGKSSLKQSRRAQSLTERLWRF